MELIIKRNKWLHNEKNSFLLRKSDGKMCCLGFLALQCGAKEEEILNLASPKNTQSVKWPKDLIQNTQIYSNIMSINDGWEDGNIEEQLIKKFKKMDIDIKFED